MPSRLNPFTGELLPVGRTKQESFVVVGEETSFELSARPLKLMVFVNCLAQSLESYSLSDKTLTFNNTIQIGPGDVVLVQYEN
jgi:hypothetical protein